MRAAATMLALVCFSSSLAEDRTVLAPDGPGPFTANTIQFIRIRAQGIAGSKISAQIDGPAKLLREDLILALSKGKRLLGSNVREFEIQPTGKGQVGVTVTITPPQPGVAPKIEKYEIEIR